MGEKTFLGQGWQYPVQAEQDQLKISRDSQNIKESIAIILNTRKGSRVMRPDFGSELHQLVFETDLEYNLIAFYVREALDQFEPRIEVLAVEARQDPEAGNRILIEIEYEILSLNSQENLVFPFYLEAP